MGIYGHKFDNYRVDLHPELMEEAGGNLFDAPKLIKGAIKEIKNYREKKRKEKEERKKKDLESLKKKQEQERRSKEYNEALEEFKKLSPKNKEIVKKLKIEEREEFIKVVKSELDKLMKDKNFKKSIDEELMRDYKRGFFMNEEEFKEYYGYLPTVHVEDNGDYIEIIDSDQDGCIIYSSICQALADKVKEKTGVWCGTGDGDEGCIYPDLPCTLEGFYCMNRKEIKKKLEI